MFSSTISKASRPAKSKSSASRPRSSTLPGNIDGRSSFRRRARSVIDPLPQFTAAILLAVVFASAAVGKLMELSTFAAVVENYRILPRLLAAPVAYVLPVVELAVALALLVPVTPPAAAGAAAILLGVFALAIGINVRRGRLTIDCGCFRSTHRQRISWWMVLRN